MKELNFDEFREKLDLWKVRDDSGLSKSDFADSLGVSERRVQQWIKNPEKIPDSKILRIYQKFFSGDILDSEQPTLKNNSEMLKKMNDLEVDVRILKEMLLEQREEIRDLKSRFSKSLNKQTG